MIWWLELFFLPIGERSDNRNVIFKIVKQRIGIFKGAPCPLVVKRMFCHLLIFGRNENSPLHCGLCCKQTMHQIWQREFLEAIYSIAFNFSPAHVQLFNFKQNCTYLISFIADVQNVVQFFMTLFLNNSRKRNGTN